MSKNLIVSTYSSQGSLVRREIWDTVAPFGLGYPFRWVIEKTETGIRLWNLKAKQAEEIPYEKATEKLHSLGNELKIRISEDRRGKLSQSWNSSQLDPEFLEIAQEGKVFKKSLFSSMGGLGLLLLTSAVVSTYFKPKEEALIPAQFAKVILTPPARPASEAAKNMAQNESKGSRAVNLVQAFKSTEVQKSTQKLLKGGVLSLLAKSNFLPDQKSRAMVSSVFDPSRSAKAPNSVSQMLNSQPVNVSAIGGQADGSQGGSVGYGKGEKAGVRGQGNTFVSLNTPEASVEEGLSKDEVGKVIHSHLSEVRYCYESAMIKNPSVQGKLVADFVIQGGGNVKVAKINMSSVGDAALDQCIIGRLAKWKFPKPRGGIDVAVVYPFIFKSLGK